MARHPDWFQRLDTILEVVRQADDLKWLGRNEMKAVFHCSERDSVRLLHKFGASTKDNTLSLPRSSLMIQLEAIRAGSTYAAFLRQRQGIAKHLSAARTEAAARQFRIAPAPPAHRPERLEDLPDTIRWQSGRFEILYHDGADLMRQLAQFLSAAGANREDFFRATEPPDDATR